MYIRISAKIPRWGLVDRIWAKQRLCCVTVNNVPITTHYRDAIEQAVAERAALIELTQHTSSVPPT